MGHVFVVQADLARVTVDHVLIPCDGDRNVNVGYLDAIAEPSVPATYRFLGERYRQVLLDTATGPGPWRATPGTPGGATPWLLDTTTRKPDPARDLDSLIGRIGDAITTIAASANPARSTRIGVPLVGLRAGGYADRYDKVIQRTLKVLHSASTGNGPNIVLVLRHRADYAAVQHLRRGPDLRPAVEADPAWQGALSTAKDLARRASDDGLVLFIGAGASKGSGLTDWWGLLETLAAQALPGTSIEELRKDLDPRDAALLIGSRMPGGEEGVRDEIASSFQPKRFALTHALLASLRVRQAITTNYDTCYESAFEAGQRPEDASLVVLPREPYRSGHPWLMKIHGDARAPRTIVLSRDDYIRFDAHSVPMASVVQSAMLTSHILFVGYSVTDENVIRLARQVVQFRKQHQGPEGDGKRTSAPVGSVLVPKAQNLKRQLWEGDLRYVELPQIVDPENAGRIDDRNLLIFLDLLGLYACQDTSYFLVDRYRGLLSDADAALLPALRQLSEAVVASPTSSAAREVVTSMLRTLGAAVPVAEE